MKEAIGVLFRVTVDHESLEDAAVTVRDTWEQERVSVEQLRSYLEVRLSY
ncbi:MAG: hypothetical protein KF881_12475 [Acidobacteria bacterium]|nr:hypothetical protein [Acidobacteriota bacterium]